MSKIKIFPKIKSEWMFVLITTLMLFSRVEKLHSNIITFDESRYVAVYNQRLYHGGPNTLIDQAMNLNFYVANGEMYITRLAHVGWYDYMLYFTPFISDPPSTDPAGRVIITFDNLQRYVRIDVSTDYTPVHSNAYLRVAFYKDTSPNNPLYSEDGGGSVEYTNTQNGIKMIIVDTKFAENNIEELEFYDLEEPEEPEELDPPTGLVALSNYDGAIPLAWKAPASTPTPESYKVYRSINLLGTYSQIASNITELYYRDETVSNGQMYYYKVKAVYESGNSEFSSAANATPKSQGNTISSGSAGSAPTLDGDINASEWSNASQTVFTFPGSSDNVTVYVMNDNSYLYFAVDDEENTALNQNDTFGILFDENNDREWPSTNTGEDGILQLFWNGSSTASAFQGFYGTWPQIHGSTWSTPSGIDLAMSTSSGNLQIEAKLNVSTCPLNVSAGNTLGILFYTFEGADNSFTGVWPPEPKEKLSTLTSGNAWAHGAFAYGDLTLAAEASPVLSASPTSLNFGTSTTSLTIQLSNSGGGTLSWSIAENPDETWITSISPSSGTNNATITVQVDRSSLSSGSSDTGILSITSNGGNQNISVSISKEATDIYSNEQSQIVRVFSLSQNYPNPFNPITTIRYQIAEPGFVSLKIYDLLGKEITTLVNEKKASGEYTVEWNGKGLPSGIYLYQLKAGEFTETRKLVLQK